MARYASIAPSIVLRNRFDSYGINLNNASLALKVEFPASGVEWSEDQSLSFADIAKALNKKKTVLVPPTANKWTARLVRKVYTS